MDSASFEKVIDALYESVYSGSGYEQVLIMLQRGFGADEIRLFESSRLEGRFSCKMNGVTAQGPLTGVQEAMHSIWDVSRKKIAVPGDYCNRCRICDDLGTPAPKDKAPGTLCYSLYNDGRRVIHIAIRSRKAGPAASDSQLAALGRHLAVASRLRRHIVDMQQKTSLLHKLIDNVRLPLLVGDAAGNTLFANDAARAWTENAHLAQVPGDRRLAEVVRTLFRKIFSGRGDFSHVTATLTLQAIAIGLPLPRYAWYPAPEGTGLGLIAICEQALSDAAGDRGAEAFAILFGLTLAESALVGQLACQGSLDNAASAMGISKETARSHLKSIFGKTKVRNQAELLRLLAPFLLMAGKGPGSQGTKVQWGMVSPGAAMGRRRIKAQSGARV